MDETKLKLLDLTEPEHELQLYYIREQDKCLNWAFFFFFKGKSYQEAYLGQNQ